MPEWAPQSILKRHYGCSDSQIRRLFERKHIESAVFELHASTLVEIFRQRPPNAAALWDQTFQRRTSTSQHLLHIKRVAKSERDSSLLEMAHFNGTSLQEWLSQKEAHRGRSISSTMVVDIMRALLAGLVELHDHNFVYSSDAGMSEASRLTEAIHVRVEDARRPEGERVAVKLAGYSLLQKVDTENAAQRKRADLRLAEHTLRRLIGLQWPDRAARMKHVAPSTDQHGPFSRVLDILSAADGTARAALDALEQAVPRPPRYIEWRQFGAGAGVGTGLAVVVVGLLWSFGFTRDAHPERAPAPAPAQPTEEAPAGSPPTEAALPHWEERDIADPEACIGYRLEPLIHPEAPCTPFFGPAHDSSAREPTEPDLHAPQARIAQGNREALEISKHQNRPILRVGIFGIWNKLGDEPNAYRSQVEELYGIAAVQFHYNHLSTPQTTDPVFVIAIASGGLDMESAPVVVEHIVNDLPLAAALGFVESRTGVQKAVSSLIRHGVFTIGTTLTDPSFVKDNDGYVAISFNNDLEAALLVAYAEARRFTSITAIKTYGIGTHGQTTDLYPESLNRLVEKHWREAGHRHYQALREDALLHCPAPGELVAFVGRYNNFKITLSNLQAVCKRAYPNASDAEIERYVLDHLVGDDSLARLYSDLPVSASSHPALVNRVAALSCDQLTGAEAFDSVPKSYDVLCNDLEQQVPAHSWLAAEALQIVADAAVHVLRETKDATNHLGAVTSSELRAAFKKTRVVPAYAKVAERKFTRLFFQPPGAKGYVPHGLKITLRGAKLPSPPSNPACASPACEPAAASSTDERTLCTCEQTPREQRCECDPDLPAPILLHAN